MASLFDKLESEAFRKGLTARSKEASVWFQKKAKELGSLGKNVLKDDRLTVSGGAKIGEMVMYTYNPKLKRQLPYYDTFPLTIVVGPAKDGFYGINLHYLPPKVRAIFLDHLNDVATNQKFNKTTKFRVTYSMLKATAKYKYFKPCFKHYLTKHVSSNIMKVNAAEWNIAIFLETAAFRKKSERFVWSRSRRQYR
tara:strand:- start:1211 stop:1795 length:585 start_codon:yes stop_codon:yes gene_type:complete